MAMTDADEDTQTGDVRPPEGVGPLPAPDAGIAPWVISHDAVSGAFNTLYLMDRLEHVRQAEHPTAQARDLGVDLAHLGDPHALKVAYFNLVQFKEFNGIYGIEEGNACLRDVARALREAFRTPYVSRFSADHFVVFYGRADVDRRIEDAHCIVAGLRREFKLWLEAGVCEPSAGQALSEACDLAKVACDQIPQDGMTFLAHYTGRIEEELKRKKYLQDHVDDAIARGDIQVWYQPVIRTLTGRMAGAEALSRWIDPTYGFVSPAVFVPALEERHLSWRLLRHVADQACADLEGRIQAGLPVVPVSINISRTDFASCDPFEVISQATATHDIPSRLVCIEITESVAMTDPEGIEQAVERFREAGYEVWMDDFGSAYSSLNTLKDFTFGKLKLDMLFLHNFNRRAKNIVISVIDMAKRLGVHTLAEGVETQEQVDFLKEAGCEELQGFFYSKPVPLGELARLMAQAEAETQEQRELYDKIGLIKIPEGRAGGFVFYDGRSFHAIYGNGRLRHQLESDGMYSLRDAEELLNGRGQKFGQLFYQVADQAVATGAPVLLPFEIAGKSYRMNVQVVAPYQDGHMLLVEPQDVTAYTQPGRFRVEAVTNEFPGQEEPPQGTEKSVGFSPVSRDAEVVWSPIDHTDRDGLDTLSALMSIFVSLINIDFTTWKMRAITIPKVSTDHLSAGDLDYDYVMDYYIERSVSEPYREAMRRMTDPSTVVDRLTRYGAISLDYVGRHLGWCRIFLIPFATGPDGAVTKALFATQDINVEKANEGRMNYAITHDALTHALNRTGLTHAASMVEGYEGQVAFVMVDVDNFKRYNDTYGHEAGDQLLTRLARLLINTFGTTDYVARIGGDEFVILLTRYDADGNGGAIQQRLARVNDVLSHGTEQPGGVSTSAGIVISTSGYRKDLYNLADEALYAAKAAGKAGSEVRIVRGAAEGA